MAERVNCKTHGGGALAQPAVVSTGLYSKHLSRLSDRFSQLVDDPASLLDLNPGLALMGVYTEHLIERAMDADTPEFREKARQLWIRADRARQWDQEQEFRELFDALGTLLDEGVQSDDILREAMVAAERRQVRVEKAAEIELKHEEGLSTRAVLALFGEVIRAVQNSVPTNLAGPIIEEIRTIAATRGSGRDNG